MGRTLNRGFFIFAMILLVLTSVGCQSQDVQESSTENDISAPEKSQQPQEPVLQLGQRKELPFELLYQGVFANSRWDNVPLRGILISSQDELDQLFIDYPSLAGTDFVNVSVDFEEELIFCESSMILSGTSEQQSSLSALWMSEDGRIYADFLEQTGNERFYFKNDASFYNTKLQNFFAVKIAQSNIPEATRSIYPAKLATVSKDDIPKIYDTVSGILETFKNEMLIYMEYSADQTTNMIALQNAEADGDLLETGKFAAVYTVTKETNRENQYRVYWYYLRKDNHGEWTEYSCQVVFD